MRVTPGAVPGKRVRAVQDAEPGGRLDQLGGAKAGACQDVRIDHEHPHVSAVPEYLDHSRVRSDCLPVLTYRALFADRSFRALWTATALTVAAGTAVSLALATVVYDRTGSALLSALALFGPSMMQVVGAASSPSSPSSRRSCRSTR